MKKQLQSFLNFLLTFVVVFLIVNFITSYFFPQNKQTLNNITLTATHTDYEMGTTVTVDLQNNTPNPVILKSNCPNEPLNVFEQQNTTWIPKHKEASIPCTNATDIVAAAGQKQTITFANWNHAIFSEPGEYKVQALVWTQAAAANSGTQETQQTAGQTQIQVTGIQATAAPSTSQQLSTTQQQASGSQQLVAGAPAAGMTSQLIESPAFQIKPQGWFSWLWTTIFYQPIYNSLIFFLNILPGHGLGLAIILLTLLIRTILMIPNQKALESQRRMQDVQPKLNHIKEKYKDNQEMIGKETLAVMQENKVNPLGSCLPLLIQFPILISLYQVVQNGLNADNSYILYSGLQHFNYSTINVIFLGVLDLTKINLIFLPIIVGALQFIQMKLAFSRLQKKSSDGKKEKSEMDSANNMMLYMMPAMIAIFTASVPAGVGIYWSTSTLYAIAQQVVVNKKAQREKDGSAKVRVIETKK